MVHVSTGVTYALQVKSSNYYLDGRDSSHSQPYMTYVSNPNSDYGGGCLKWRFELLSNGYYAIKCMSNGYYLDGRDGGNKDAKMTNTSDPLNYGAQCCQWKIEENTGFNGYVSLQCVRGGSCLDGRDSNHRNVKVSARSANGDSVLSWRLIPLNVKLHCYINEFAYLTDIQQELENKKVAEITTKNTVVCDDVGLSVGTQFTESVENTYTYGFSESLGGGCGVEIDCKIPLLFSATVNVNFNFTFETNQTFSKSEEQVIKEEYSFSPQEPGTYEVGMIVYQSKDVELPFVACCNFTAKDYNSDSVNGIDCSGDDIRSIMDYYGSNCEVIEENDKSVDCKINGTLTGGWWVETYVKEQKVSDDTKTKGNTYINSYVNKLKSIENGNKINWSKRTVTVLSKL